MVAATPRPKLNDKTRGVERIHARRRPGASLAARSVDVTVEHRAKGEIPECFTLGVLAWSKLAAAGLVEQFGQRLLLERKDGCTGAVLLGRLLLMSFGNLRGQRALQRGAAGCEDALAAVTGARRWHTQASMSRSLGSVTAEQAREFADWLLGEALPVGALDRDDSAFHRDTLGEPWRMVDADGRVIAVRQRGLPEGDGLPTARRLAASIAKPGYPGRKRGEVQFHQMKVQDAGTGRWIGVRLGPGGGDHHEDMCWAALRAAQWSDRLGIERSRVCTRFDGKAAGAPSLLACVKEGIAFLTRWSDYRPLEQAAVRASIERGAWRWCTAPVDGLREPTEVPRPGSRPRSKHPWQHEPRARSPRSTRPSTA